MAGRQTPDKVLILAEKTDPHATAVAKILHDEHECSAEILSLAAFPVSETAAFAFDAEAGESERRLGPIDLTSVGVVWWRRPSSSSPPKDYFLFDKDFVQIECDHFLEGLLWSNRCTWINDPMRELKASRKLVQLSTAAALGLKVPRTIVTNDPAAARRFVSECDRPLITKRVGTSRGLATRTTLLTPDELDRLETVQTCPTLLQDYIEPGGDIRVAIFGTDVHAFWIDSAAGDEPVDSRLDLSVAHKPYDLPETLRQSLRRLLDELGLVSGIIDLRVAKDRTVYFLEVNPSGQYLYLELLTGYPLSRSMASLLARAGALK